MKLREAVTVLPQSQIWCIFLYLKDREKEHEWGKEQQERVSKQISAEWGDQLGAQSQELWEQDLGQIQVADT